MAHLGTLHDFAFDRDVDDIRGTTVYGTNGDKLGKLEDFIFDHATGDIHYAVIDTGGWLSSKKFLVPADRIHTHGKDENAFQVDMTKERIEQFPRYDEKSLRSEKDWKDYEDQYRRHWDVDPVQHREDRVDLDITPATVTAGTTPTGVPPAGSIATDSGVALGSLGEEVTDEYAESGEERARSDDERLADEEFEEDVTPHRLAGKFPETLQTSDKIQMSPAEVPERTYPQARVGTESVPNRSWQDNPTGSGGHRIEEGRESVPVDPRIEQGVQQSGEAEQRKDIHGGGTGEWNPRMKRFEDVLRRNRVDVTASCPSCAPAKDKAA